MDKSYYLKDPRFKSITPFESKIWLSSPTMHGDEEKWVVDAIRKNWVSTVGENINEVERMTAEKIGCKYAVGLSSGTAALHLAVKLAGERLYGQPKVGHGTLEGHKVFCSDMTFDATVNPVAYEDGEAVFIDTEYDTWNMDPEALERAFEIYPDVRLVILAHLYGTPYKGKQTGNLFDYGILSHNGNKIVTSSSSGMFLMDSKADADKVRKWSTQSRENAPWYQHEELGYNYRMSNITAGVVRGQLPYLEEHIGQKKAIYERYKENLKDLPVSMNPVPDCCEPNYWLSCLLINKDAMCPQMRGEQAALYKTEPGKSCPTEILEAMMAFNAEGRPIWKPMHMQPIYRMSPFVTKDGNGRGKSNAYIAGETAVDVGMDIFERGLCLPSDNKMTAEDVDKVCEIIRRCFG